MLEARPALPRHTGKKPGLLLPWLAVRPRARSLAGPYSLSSLASASRVPKSPSAHFQPATAKPGPQSAFRSPPPGAAVAPTPRSHLVQPPSAKAALSSRRQRCISTWSGLLQALGSASLLWTQIQQAVNVADHVATSVRKYSVGTLEAYLSLCLRFLDFCVCTGLQVGTLTLAALADYLQACAESHKQDRTSCKLAPKQALKALSWLARIAELPCLKDLLGRPLIAAFRTDSEFKDRKEALPLPLAALCAWERALSDTSCPTQLALLLGGLLLAAHASLRFGDLQRISLDSLSLTASALRGICWATKTSSSGQPFAVTLTGITGRDIASSWVLHWLRHVQASWKATESEWHELWANVCPDFILPILPQLGSLSQEPFCFGAPMSYPQALAALRWAVQTAWDSRSPPPVTASEAPAFTLRSLKVSLLSATAQLRLSDEARRRQGHHKQQSVDLYGRDDTIDALWLQQEVALACSEGWRPSRPISRGGQAPTLGASFQVPRSQPPAKLDISKTPWDLERFTYHREIQQLREQHMLDKPSESDLRTEPSTLAQAPQEALMPPQAETARDEEAAMVEAAALAREANKELSDDSDIESAHEQDGLGAKCTWPSQTPKSLKQHVGPSSAS